MNEVPVAIQCKSCQKPIVLDQKKFHCVSCSLDMLKQSFMPRSKSEKLRKWRKFGYDFCITVMLFALVNRYFGFKVQMIATGFFVLPSILDKVSEKLSRIF